MGLDQQLFVTTWAVADTSRLRAVNRVPVSLVQPSLCTEMSKFLLQLCKLRKAAPLRRALVHSVALSVHVLALAPLQMHCSMTASGAENWTDCWTDGCTSAAVECVWRGAREIKVYHCTRRRELYTTGCSEPREADMDGREVVP